jgi:hypothetical protein
LNDGAAPGPSNRSAQSIEEKLLVVTFEASLENGNILARDT